MRRRPRARRVAAFVVAVIAGLVAYAAHAEKPAEAGPSGAALYVHSPASGTVRLRVSEGPGAECDSAQNAMRFDGEIRPGETLRVPVAGPCACVSSTSSAFPDIDWSHGQRVCKGRRVAAAASFAFELDGR